MRAFFLAYREILQIASGELVSTLGSAKVQTASGLLAAQDGMAAVAAQFPLPWSHYVRLLAVRNPEARRCGLVPKFLGLMLELGGDFTFVGRQRRRHLVPNRPDVFSPPPALPRCHRSEIGPIHSFRRRQMHLYLNYAREHWTLDGENPPVGLVLCAEKDSAVARYALEGLPNKILAAE